MKFETYPKTSAACQDFQKLFNGHYRADDDRRLNRL